MQGSHNPSLRLSYLAHPTSTTIMVDWPLHFSRLTLLEHSTRGDAKTRLEPAIHQHAESGSDGPTANEACCLATARRCGRPRDWSLVSRHVSKACAPMPARGRR